MLLICIASLLTCSAAASEFSVFVPDTSVSERLGSSAVLPCGLSPSLNAETFEVRWHKNDYSNPVLLYNDLKVQENAGDPQYRGRVSLIGELQKGNVSLKLENLELADRGEYVCMVKSVTWYEWANINLTIKVRGSSPLLSVAQVGDEVNVSCASGGWSPKPTLIWKDRGGRELRNNYIHYKTDSEGLVSVSSWLLFSPSESEWISCSVGSSDQEMKEGRVQPNKEIWRDAFISTLVLSLIIIIILTALLLLVRQGLFPHCSSHKNAKAAVNSLESIPAETVPLKEEAPPLTEKAKEKTVSGISSQSSVSPESSEERLQMWNKLKKQKVKLTVDPDTRHRSLMVTRDGTGVYCGTLSLSNPADPFPHILSKEEFSSGLKYWEVTVDQKEKSKKSWCVGVTQKPPTKETLTALCYEERCGIYPSTDPHIQIPAEDHVSTLGLILDFKHKTLSFINVDKRSHLHTFRMNNMTKNKYFALISPGIKDNHNVSFHCYRPQQRSQDAHQSSLYLPLKLQCQSDWGHQLSCRVGLSPSLNAETFEVRWHKDDYNKPVLLYKDLKVQENAGDPQYRGRASLIGELQKGNVSLKLENLELADRGRICSSVPKHLQTQLACSTALSSSNPDSSRLSSRSFNTLHYTSLAPHTVLLFLWIMFTLLSTSKAVKFSVLVPNSVSAVLGSSVVLPCELSPSYDAETFEFRWYRNKDYDNPILLYENLKVQENAGDPQYRGRVSLMGELERGNVSLKLENLTVADNGEYMCNVESPQWYDRANISLLVKALGTVPVFSFAEVGAWMNVTCASSGWSPRPTVIWKDRGGRELESSTDHYITDSEGLVSVSSWLLLSPLESEWISCSVGLSDQEMREGRVPPLKPVSTVEIWREAFISTLVLALIIIIILAALLLLVRQGLVPHCSPHKNAEDAEEKIPLTGSGDEILRTWNKLRIDKEKLTVDPETCQKPLMVTQDGAGVSCGKRSRSDVHTFPHVLSKEEFSSGLKYWEVTVDQKEKSKKSWCVGVTQEPHTKETLTALCYEERCGIYPSTDPRTQIPAEDHVTTLGLILDFTHKTLSFYNVDKESHLHTFRMNNMSNNTYFALISPGIKDNHPVSFHS
ncbi:uncharacterized protein LOC118816862 [Colossoma macropomum]|uniref:uncharacterized protein LOC118816862 n=1 Tax=Colossoma macropomum TaxID=42526 RepID=UPI001864E6FA|nr:uncharacterized protein LOC118816862 [Colossoma macropomum]